MHEVGAKMIITKDNIREVKTPVIIFHFLLYLGL